MILPINSKYRIASDQYQWKIQRRRNRTRNGKRVEVWESFKYYPSLCGAVRGLRELLVSTSSAVGLTSALEVLDEVNTTLSRALERCPIEQLLCRKCASDRSNGTTDGVNKR